MSFFVVYDEATRKVKRTGVVPVEMVSAQARLENEVSVETDAEYQPNDLYVDDDLIVRRVSNGAGVQVEE